ncbi:MAG: class I tRNA ligase family protein, partial [Planctomycetes bacterium]|nr:class I tRNA ligase family protein [Planctomycetota bacterium]
MPVFHSVPDRYDFPAAEAEVCRFWKESRIFEKSLDLRAGRPAFVFYEGPPTANGRPHPGHVLTRVIKDLFPRYRTMRGFRVDRKAGWDTHGLPVEIEVEKSLGISGKEEIETYGVEKFCKHCIESVFVYTREWEELTERIGFWVDLSDAYVTFHQSYVESVWWSLKRLFDLDLLYQDRKVVWWWAQGGTTLSAAEVGLGYREVDDPSVYVRFRDADDSRLSYLAWTTTPWTLPSNVALAVSPREPYVEVTVPAADGGEERLVMAAALVDKVLGAKKEKSAIRPTAVSEPFAGEALAGRRYRQLLPWKQPEGGRVFEIITGDFVLVDPTLETASGT